MEIGQVIEKKGNLVRLQMVRNAACGSCHACTMGTESKVMEIYALNLCDAKEKDMVEIHLESDSFLTAVSIAYGLPLMGLLLGLLLGYGLSVYVPMFGQEVLAILMGFGVMGLTFLIIWSQRKRFKRKKYTPKAIRVLEAGEW